MIEIKSLTFEIIVSVCGWSSIINIKIIIIINKYLIMNGDLNYVGCVGGQKY